MVELVDTLALGASAARREGSSPFIRTIQNFCEPEECYSKYMSTDSEVIIVFPEDYVIEGAQLETLFDKLAPRGEELTRLLGRTSMRQPQPTFEALAIGEAAIRDTLSAIDRPLSNRSLQAIINRCWDRVDQQSDTSIRSSVRLSRGDVVSQAFWAMANKGELDINTEDRLIRLVRV